MSWNVQVCDHVQDERTMFDSSDFKDSAGTPESKTVSSVLEKLGLRVVTNESRKSNQDRSAKATTLRTQHGLVLNVNAEVLYPNQFMWCNRLAPVKLGSLGVPARVIIESELEVTRDYDYEDEDQKVITLPFVRCWSPDLKRYVFIDVDDVAVHKYDPDPRGKLVLPAPMRHVLDAVFDHPADSVFGDAFRGRHGGIVILANGPSGVGKTLTAEVYAEYTKRPLYVLEMGELGTSLDSVEENLQRIFARAARWNAILLFDEADIFLAKRQETDLERSAIVGVFLRLLDRYEGTFFLTTNRAEVIDPAFKSRITLKVDYPELGNEFRAKVWDIMLSAGGFELTGELNKLAENDVNGRQIRNQVRLLGALYPDKKVTVRQIAESLMYVAK